MAQPGVGKLHRLDNGRMAFDPAAYAEVKKATQGQLSAAGDPRQSQTTSRNCPRACSRRSRLIRALRVPNWARPY